MTVSPSVGKGLVEGPVPRYCVYVDGPPPAATGEERPFASQDHPRPLRRVWKRYDPPTPASGAPGVVV